MTRTKTINEEFKEWEVSNIILTRPAPAVRGEMRGHINTQQVNEGFSRGVPALVRAEFGVRDQHYCKGDLFLPRNGEDVTRLSGNMFLVPLKGWLDVERHNFYKEYFNSELQPAMKFLEDKRRESAWLEEQEAQYIKALADIKKQKKTIGEELKLAEEFMKEKLEDAPEWHAPEWVKKEWY